MVVSALYRRNGTLVMMVLCNGNHGGDDGLM